MEQTDQNKLTLEIIERSNAKTWQEAKWEWEIESIFNQTEPDTCLCGHSPIMELCILRNRCNGNRVTVGNVCVKKFLGLESDPIFKCVRRVTKDIKKPLNRATLDHALRQGWISHLNHFTYVNVLMKRNLFSLQLPERIKINQLILAQINKNRK
jgi:hypothetical protein